MFSTLSYFATGIISSPKLFSPIINKELKKN